MLRDLWGADSTQNASTVYPGTNGDWVSWDAYLTNVIADIKKSNMTNNLDIDIWSEPDLITYWGASQTQWLALWGRTYARLRYDQFNPYPPLP